MRADIYRVSLEECDSAHPLPGVYVDLLEDPEAEPVGPFTDKVSAYVATLFMLSVMPQRVLH